VDQSTSSSSIATTVDITTTTTTATTTTVGAPLNDTTQTATPCATIQAPYTVSTVGPVENESASGFTLNPAAQPFPTY